MLLGAAVGRLIGDAAGELVGGLSGGGLFALVGAAAMLGGYTRLALTVAVLLVEATGDVGAAVPVLAASLVGSGASAALAPASYDDVLLHLRRVPYLEDAVPEATAALPVAAVCDANGPRLRAREPAAAVAAAVEAERLYHLVVDGRGRHAGVASRQALAAALGGAERKCGDVVDGGHRAGTRRWSRRWTTGSTATTRSPGRPRTRRSYGAAVDVVVAPAAPVYDYADVLVDDCDTAWADAGTTMPCVETAEQNHALVTRSGTAASRAVIKSLGHSPTATYASREDNTTAPTIQAGERTMSGGASVRLRRGAGALSSTTKRTRPAG